MSSLDVLSKKRSFAKRNFIHNNNKLYPLVGLIGVEACESLSDVKDLMVKVEHCFSVFTKAHENYLEVLEDETLEKDVDTVLDKEFKYLNEVESSFMSIRKKIQ